MASRKIGAALAATVLALLAAPLAPSLAAASPAQAFAQTPEFSQLSGTSSDAVAPAAKAATTTRLTESTSEVNYGNESSVQFTAEVIGGDPEGESVEVKVGNAGSGSTACTAHLTAGVGKCSIEQNAALPAAFASYEVSASYAGDASLEPSRATITGGLTIDGGRTFTTVSVNPAKLTYGAETPVSVTAAVTAEGNTPLPSGETARITLAGESCTASLSGGAESTGSCTISTTPELTPGSYAATAEYEGDLNLSDSKSTNAASLTVEGSPTSFAITVNGSETSASITYGSTATLAESGLPAGAQGTVTFSSAGTELCHFTLSASTASCNTSSGLAAGEYTGITAKFEATGGSGFSSASATNSLTLLVSPATTTFTITVNNSETSASIAYGSAATLAESKLPAGAQGTVTFTSAGTELCHFTVSPSTTSCTTSKELAAGKYAGITATFITTSGDYAGSSATNTVSLTVGAAPTSFKITVNSSETSASVTYGSAATLGESGLSAGAQGTVTFTSGTGPGAVELCSFTPSASTTSCTTSRELTAAAYTDISATYASTSGDYAGSTSTNSLSLTVEQAETTFTIVVNGSEKEEIITHGSNATLAEAGLPAGAQGTVAFSYAGIELCNFTLSAAKTSCTTPSTLGRGKHQDIKATFAATGGDYAGSEALNRLSLTVELEAPFKIAVGSSETSASITYGSTATLAESPVSQLPSGAQGKVTFTSAGTELCHFTLPTTSCTTADELPARGYADVTATFTRTGGEFESSTSSNEPSLTVTPAETKFTITIDGGSSLKAGAGTSATLAEAGLPAGARGTVTFSSGATELCATTLPVASCATSSRLAVSSYGITAAFDDTDGNYSGSSSTGAVALTLERLASVVEITSTPSPSTPYTPLTLTAKVASQAPAAITPTGTVTFKSGSHTLGTAMLDGAGVARLTTAAPPPGSYYASAVYEGDGDYAGGGSPTIIQTVKETFSGLFGLTANYLDGSGAYRRLPQKRRIAVDGQLTEVNRLLDVAGENASESVLAATIYDADITVLKDEGLLKAPQAEALIKLANGLPAPRIVAVASLGRRLKGHSVAVGTVRAGNAELSLRALKPPDGDTYQLTFQTHAHGQTHVLLIRVLTIA